MSNNFDKNVKNQDNLKSNRLSLPSSSSASSFDYNESKGNPYSHLEYYQKMENLLSHNQAKNINSMIFETSVQSPVVLQKLGNQNATNSSNLFNYNFPRFQNWTNQKFINSNNFSINSCQMISNIQKFDSSSKSNDNDNLITFETNEDLNVLDAFDPLKSKNFQDGLKINTAKSLESLNKFNDIVNIKDKKLTERLCNDHKIRSNSSLETQSVYKNDLSIEKKLQTKPLQNYPSEIANFFQNVFQFRNSLEIHQNSKLTVYSPKFEFQLSKFKNLNIYLNIRYNNNTDVSKRYQPLRILVSFSSNVETILYHVLNSYQIEELDVSKYFLKIHGLEEYLPLNCSLAELKYFFDCINENREPVLILVEIQNTINSPSELNPVKSIQYDPSFDNMNAHQISQTKIDSLVLKISESRSLLLRLTQDENEIEKLDKIHEITRNLIDNLVSLKTSLFDIGHDLIELSLFKLNACKDKLKHLINTSSLNEKEPLISSRVSYGYSIDNSDSLKSGIVKDLKIQIEKLNGNLYSFIKSTCRSFYSDMDLDLISRKLSINDFDIKEKNISEIIQADSKLTIYFKGISRLGGLINRLNPNINTSVEMFLKFSVIYGRNILDNVIVRLDKIDRNLPKKNDYLIKTIKVQFDRIDLCLIPREACLLIELVINYNSNLNNASVFNAFGKTEKADEKIPTISSSKLSFLNRDDPNIKCIAWASKSLFDDNLVLESNEYFLSMFETWSNNSSACCDMINIYSNKSPVVQIEFLAYENFYKYPNAINECECKLKDFQSLPNDLKDTLIEICNQSIAAIKMTEVQRDLINEYFNHLNGIPFSLSKVYLSLISYDYSSIIHFYAYLRQCDPLSMSEAIELLLPYFPDQELRKHAVKSIELNTIETILSYLPQLLEALKYEKSHHSDLALMLLRLAGKSLRFFHKLYWYLEEFKSREKDFIYIRYHLLLEALKYFSTPKITEEIELEAFMTKNIDQIGKRIKDIKDNDRLLGELDMFQKNLMCYNKFGKRNYRLPFNISYCVKEIDIKSCSFINSFTVPLKLVFKNSDVSANSFYTIYKIGDDLRQDMLVIQMINVMNQLWLADDLDLNIVTFDCLQTGNRRGFIEMITNAETLKEIQKGAVINAFKKNCINEWLRSHNPTINNFKKAIDNFTRSCAGYSIATYLLGIGDRHNDNIMIKYTGHMFHIDFGKYLGDAQTFAGFKRDRTPILFTSDMFYAINQSKEPNFRFQEFIELCCQAFQILRKNHVHLLSIVELMIDSGIPGLNKNAIQYIYKNLMIELDEDESSNMLKKIIHDSLGKFASINFAIHTLAQPKTVSSSNYFSFVSHIFNSETDGKILEITIKLSESTSSENLRGLIKCSVVRETEFESNDVYRTFEEFCELYHILSKTFTTLRLSESPSYSKFKEAKQFLKRCLLVENFLKEIMSLPAEISQSEIIYTFFHPILRDKKETFYSKEDENVLSLSNSQSREAYDSIEQDVKGEVKLKLRFKENKFFVNCLQCRNLKPPYNQSVSSLKPYVKCYLRPDYTKSTKKKVQALFNGANPIFTETMEYDIGLDELKKRTLELTVLNNRINFKEKLGSIEIKLADIDWLNEYVSWYFLR